MIALELTYPKSIVRIHDECCQTASERQMTAINGIVSESYKRRMDGDFSPVRPNT